MTGLKIVLRIGGSILGSPPTARVVTSYSEIVKRIVKKRNDRVIIVVGGGGLAREYIKIARDAGLPHEMQDIIAIEASRLNARLVGLTLGVDHVSVTIADAISSVKRKTRIAVMGGLKPGITTDTVATLVAEAWDSDLIVKASDQEGIYTADPRSVPDAKLLRTVSYSRLVQILGGEHSPGIHSIVDPVAVRRIARRKIRMFVVKGDDPENVWRAINNEAVGTVVG